MTLPGVSCTRFCQPAATISLLLLIALCLAWELWLAPLRPGGSWLALKAVPLLTPLFGILHGRRYTYQWSSLLIHLYLLEGLMRIFSASTVTQVLAGIEVLLALVFFTATLCYVRTSAPVTAKRIKAGD